MGQSVSPFTSLLATPLPAFQDIINLDIVSEDGVVLAQIENTCGSICQLDLLLLLKLQEKPNRSKHKSEILFGL